MDELISFETAKLAKEKGFREEVLHFYCINSVCNYIERPYQYSFRVDANRPYEDNFGYGLTTSAPSQSILQKWLRDIHGILIYLLPISSLNRTTDIWGFDITNVGHTHTQGNRFEIEQEVGTYEEALEAGLLEALKLVKQT